MLAVSKRSRYLVVRYPVRFVADKLVKRRHRIVLRVSKPSIEHIIDKPQLVIALCPDEVDPKIDETKLTSLNIRLPIDIAALVRRRALSG